MTDTTTLDITAAELADRLMVDIRRIERERLRKDVTRAQVVHVMNVTLAWAASRAARQEEAQEVEVQS